LRTWDIETAQEAFGAKPGGFIEEVAWSPDGNLLAISTTDLVFGPDGENQDAQGSLTIVDRSGAEVAPVPDEDHFVQIRSIAFTRDGKRVIGLRTPTQSWATYFGNVTIWDWKTGQIERTIDTGQYEAVLSLRADLLVSTPFTDMRGSQVAEVWDWTTGTHLRTLRHSGTVTQASFSRDGSRLATASEDGTVWVWDPHSDGPEQLVLRGHTGPVRAVAFSPDGSRLASASEDGTVRIWALDLDALVATAERGLTRTLTDDECRQYLHVDRCPTAAVT
jgi:WD40 repeat protein